MKSIQVQPVNIVVPKAQEYCVEFTAQAGKAEIHPQTATGFNADATDIQNIFDFTSGALIPHFVCCKSVLIEAPGLAPGLENRNLVTVYGQAVSAGKASRAGANHGDMSATVRCTPECLHTLCKKMISGMTLQAADPYRLLFGRVFDAYLLAQFFHRTNIGAGTAHDVFAQNGNRRTTHIAGGNLADKARYIDAGRTSLCAGCVITEQAAGGLHGSLVRRQSRVQIREISLDVFRVQAAGPDVVGFVHRSVPVALPLIISWPCIPCPRIMAQ